MLTKRHILLIEQSKSQAFLLKAILEDKGFKVWHASSSSELNHMLEQHNGFFLAISSLDFDDATSLKLLDIVIGHGLVTLIFTASVSEQLENLVSTRPIADYILKSGKHSLDLVARTCEQIWANAHLSVLIVEDSRSNATLLTRITCNQGFKVRTVTSAEEVPGYLEEERDKVDIVVLDHNLPGRTGLVCCFELREKYSHSDMAILGISGANNASLAVDYIKGGADDFIKKPFKPEEYICRINKIAQGIARNRMLTHQLDNGHFVLRVMGHDIRTPLNIIKLAFGRIKKGLTLDDKQKNLSLMVENSIEQTNNLVEACLFFCRLNVGDDIPLEHINVDETLSEIIGDMSATASERNINMTLSNHCIDQSMLANKFLLSQALKNLMTNAFKYSPKNGTVEVQVEQQESLIKISVIDQGEGVKKEYQDDLFTAFSSASQQSSKNVESFGLGLSIVKQATDAMNGTIDYRDNIPCGACFTLSLKSQ